MVTRRDFVVGTAGAALLASRPATANAEPRADLGGARHVVTPNGATLPLVEKGGVKIGHLVAEPVSHELAPGLMAECWGYNGRVHGPTIEAVEGDRVRIYVENRLPEPTTVHWHGMLIANAMDGVAGLNQRAIPVGEVYRYEFVLPHAGTFMYHPHFDEMTQMALGLMGMFIVHPRVVTSPVDHDFAIMLSEWAMKPGSHRPDPLEMTDFNVLTMNARAFPGTEPLVVGLGKRVRIRFGNLSAMDHHPIHIHGHAWHVTATDGGPVPRSAQWPETTVLVPVGATRDVEFIADNPGDWAMHCHMTHHIMNQMGHGTPNLIGARLGEVEARLARFVPSYMAMGSTGMGGMGEMQMAVPDNTIPMLGAQGPHGHIDMGGMFTLVKVRASGDDSEWYQAPPETQARKATQAELDADGIGQRRGA